MNKTITLLPYEATEEELQAQNSAETRNYKEQKEELKLKDKLDLWNTALYGEQIASTLDATNSIDSMTRVNKANTQRELLRNLFAQNKDDQEYKQTA